MSASDLSAGGGNNRNPFNYIKVEQIDRDSLTAWLDIADIRDQVNLYGDTSQDNYLSMLELSSRQYIEDYLGMPIFAITYRVYYSPESLINVPATLDLPFVSQSSYPSAYTSQTGLTINTVKYWNANNSLTTVSASNYYYDQSGNKIVISSLPTDISTDRTAPIYCEYLVQANPLAEYPVIKQAALLLITHWYNVRAQATDKIMREIPFGFHALLRSYKPLVL